MKESGKPLVSVILCFYNEEKFIDEAIGSVLKQDYSQWELILVDDGSTDKSTSIARDYARQHPGKIFYRHHPGHCNEGLSASRNLGIEGANGEYVAFIDADDVWLPDKLTYQLDRFKTTGVKVVLEASLYWNSWTDASKADILVPVGVMEGIYRPPQLMTTLYPLGNGAAPCPSGIIVHRSVLDRFRFEESFRGIYQMYEDQAFLCKLYLNEHIFVSASCHNKYRQRPSSLVTSVYETGKYHMVRKYYLQWFTAYLRSHRISHRHIRSLVRKASMPYQEPWKYKLTVDYPKLAKAIAARVFVKLGLLSYNKT